jgi:anti-sigma regulatory factor (Ser/Thr protein kinase)
VHTVLVTIPCEPSQLWNVRHRLRRWLEASDVPVSLQDSIVLGVHEAAANAMEHAIPCESLAIRASIENRVLTVEVTDTGRWTEEDVPDTDEGGRGLHLMRALIEHVAIHPGPAGTTVHLRQPL